MNQRLRRSLEYLLSRLYPTRTDAERICERARIDTRLVQTEGQSPANLWYTVIRQAELTAALVPLVEAALEDYPSEAALSGMLRELRRGDVK